MSDLRSYIRGKSLEGMSVDDLAKEGNKIAEAIQRARIRQAREDPNAFNEFVFGIKQAQIHREWQELISDKSSNRTLILAPRDHGKTTQIKGRCLWEVGHNPNLRIKYVMGVDNKAKGVVSHIGSLIDRNERVRLVFPHLRPGQKETWTKHELFVERTNEGLQDATFEAAGVLSSAVSGRADKLIFDDIVTPQNAVHQPALQKQVKYQYANAWIPTLEEEGEIIYIATPWTDRDQTADIMRERGNWKVWKKPAIVDGEAIWPEKWDIEALDRRLKDMNNNLRAFDQQYMLKVVTEGEQVFKIESIEACKRRDIWIGEELNKNWPRYIGVDIAGSEGKGNYTVVFVIAVDDKGRRWVVDITRQRIRVADIAKLVYDKYIQHLPEVVMVENNSLQQVVIDQLTEINCSVPVQGHYTGAKKHNLSMGVPSLATQIDNGSWVIPFAGDHDDMLHECPICAWIDEMVAYPVGEFSDTVMAMWFADIAARGGKFSKTQFDSWYETPMTNSALRKMEQQP